jgi:hypothetical protein
MKVCLAECHGSGPGRHCVGPHKTLRSSVKDKGFSCLTDLWFEVTHSRYPALHDVHLTLFRHTLPQTLLLEHGCHLGSGIGVNLMLRQVLHSICLTESNNEQRQTIVRNSKLMQQRRLRVPMSRHG